MQTINTCDNIQSMHISAIREKIGDFIVKTFLQAKRVLTLFIYFL